MNFPQTDYFDEQIPLTIKEFVFSELVVGSKKRKIKFGHSENATKI